ncbi:MAG: DUF86 domain-containing protein [Phycisphaerales bacterium]|nr:DUF86 domain-containing protein [Phycisphaerales bacterium]
MSKRSPQILLTDLLEHARRAVEIVGGLPAEELEKDELRRAAFLWNLVVIGEVALRTPESIRNDFPQIPWRDIIAQRNVVAHGYDVLSWEILHKLAKVQLPAVIEIAQRAIDEFGPPPA